MKQSELAATLSKLSCCHATHPLFAHLSKVFVKQLVWCHSPSRLKNDQGSALAARKKANCICPVHDWKVSKPQMNPLDKARKNQLRNQIATWLDARAVPRCVRPSLAFARIGGVANYSKRTFQSSALTPFPFGWTTSTTKTT